MDTSLESGLWIVLAVLCLGVKAVAALLDGIASASVWSFQGLKAWSIKTYQLATAKYVLS